MNDNRDDKTTVSLPLKYVPAILQLLAMVGVGVGATHLGGDGSHLDCARRLDLVESRLKQNTEHLVSHGVEIREIHKDDNSIARELSEIRGTQSYIMQEVRKK